jgi:hypothetical protein
MTTSAPKLTDRLADARATDYFFLREQLTDEQLGALRRVRAFVDAAPASIRSPAGWSTWSSTEASARSSASTPVWR